MKGDRVEIIVDTGNGVQRFEIEATKSGRRVDVSTTRGIVEVAEELATLAAIGITFINLWPAGEPSEQRERLAAEVLPQLRGEGA